MDTYHPTETANALHWTQSTVVSPSTPDFRVCFLLPLEIEIKVLVEARVVRLDKTRNGEREVGGGCMDSI